jgi:hypothetical protein
LDSATLKADGFGKDREMAMLARAKLTKSFLMAQRTGTYVVVTSGGPPGPCVPRFDERLGPLDARLAQWERIKASGADGSLCRVREAEDLASRTIAEAKLTKGLLMAQPEGAYLASNAWVPVKPGPDAPCWQGHVAPPEGREAQWNQIKAAGSEGRTCNVYERPEDHTRWLATFPARETAKCSKPSTVN